MEDKLILDETEETLTQFAENATSSDGDLNPGHEHRRGPAIQLHPRARKVYAGMWGKPEIAVVGVALFAVLSAILLFVVFVLPAQKRLSDNQAKRRELEKKLAEATSRYGTITSTQTRVEELRTSVDDFEMRSLPGETTGKAAFYQQVNGLIAAYGLTNTAGPDYSPLEVIDASRTSQPTEEAQGRAKLASIYPGMYITMTLDGSYQNLRRFIREMETSNQFVVISSIELEPSENKAKEKEAAVEQPQTVAVPGQQNFPPGFNNPAFPSQPVTQTDAQKIDRGKTRGETVTLRMEMAAYFRR